MRDAPVVARALVLATGVLLACRLAPAQERGRLRSGEIRVVSRDEILEHMKHSRGYALTATGNGPRLQAEVVLRLIREAETTDPERRLLLIGHREWYEAFLERNGLTQGEAPLYVRVPNEIGQDILLDYRRERVIEDVLQGPEPRTVANVHIFWPSTPGRPKSYSYDDLLANPNLRVTQKQHIRYRLLDYEDRLWYAEVDGLHGRPTSGVLGRLFDLLGEVRVLESRSAFAPDGMQVVRARGKKLLVAGTSSLTVWPDGRADRGVPNDRPDLRALERRLWEPLAIRFRPLDPEDDPG